MSELRRDKDYTPLTPTARLHHTIGSVTVQTALYGPTTAERIAKELAATMHRADQLCPLTGKQKYEFYRELQQERRSEEQDDYDE